MTMCEPLPQSDCERTELEELIWCAVGFLAKTSHVQGIKPGSSTPTVKSLEADSGGKCIASLRTSGQSGYWQRMYGTYSALPMFQEEGEEPSDIYCETWPRFGMMLHGFVMELPTLERRTRETGYSFWATPRANKIGGKSSPGFAPTLEQCVKNWPTPRATDGEHGGPNQRDSSGRPALPAAIHKLWATPAAQDCQGTTGGGQSRSLRDDVHGHGGQLNADWVECLMGFPIGWSDVNCDTPAEWPGWPAPLGAKNWTTPNANDHRESDGTMRPSRIATGRQTDYLYRDVKRFTETGQYSYEPPRVISGQKNRAKRLKCLGNAVVPQQIYPIFAAIAEIERVERGETT